MNSAFKETIMAQAVAMARKGRGLVEPNPCVGAVLTQDDQIVASGFHRRFGGEHAEIEALQEARKSGVDLTRTTLWVTLEPCNHHGKTPPCTRAIVEAGIPKVVLGTRDPNPGVSGGGLEYLRSRSIHVETGILEEACQDLIRDFVTRLTRQRPYLILKLATTLDGKIATRSNDSHWVTGAPAREEVHRLRSQVNAVCIGGRTFVLDNPGLDCRTQTLAPGRQPLALIICNSLPHDPGASRLLCNRPEDVLFMTSEISAASAQAEKLKKSGARIIALPSIQSGLDLLTGMKDLLRRDHCYTVLCEGGGRLAGSLMQQGLVDELSLFLAPRVLGDELGVSAVSGLRPLSMTQTHNFRLATQARLGDDLWLTLYPDPSKE